MRHFIIGTAGHIDHGKTSLVKALTGIDTDRLKEEKLRGITIDLGFAYWKDHITIIDVPGHEKFIRNMVAGVSAIDFVLLVIAADDGIMPQTREHLEILQLLQIPHGAVVITKIDTVESNRLNEVEAEIRIFLEPTIFSAGKIFRVSSVTKEGIGELTAYLEHVSQRPVPNDDRGFFRMNVDRSFSMKGYGTVVTGTVLSGSVKVGDYLAWQPDQKPVRVRGLQKHTRAVGRVTAGDRAAINLSSVDKNEIRRGHVLIEPDYLALTHSFYAKIHMLNSSAKSLKSPVRIRLLIGTAERFGKIQTAGDEPLIPGNSGYVRIAVDEPLTCVFGDRFIIREFNSSATVGGGMVLDQSQKEKAVPVDYLKSLETESLSDRMAFFIYHHKIVSLKHIISVMGCLPSVARNALEAIQKNNRIVFLSDGIVCDALHFSELQAKLIYALQSFLREHPSENAIRTTEFKMRYFENMQDEMFQAVIERLERDRVLSDTHEWIHLEGHRLTVNPKDEPLLNRIENRLIENLFSPPALESLGTEMNLKPPELTRLIALMVRLNKAVKTGEKIYFHSSAVDRARQILIDFIGKNGDITVINFKEQLQTSRKFAISLLEFFDASHITLRDGDSRKLNR